MANYVIEKNDKYLTTDNDRLYLKFTKDINKADIFSSKASAKLDIEKHWTLTGNAQIIKVNIVKA